MFHFPIWRGQLPLWLPRVGGSYFEFFQPVFNIADAAITMGIFLFIIAQRRMKHAPSEEPAPNTPDEAPSSAVNSADTPPNL